MSEKSFADREPTSAATLPLHSMRSCATNWRAVVMEGGIKPE
jgi:hypothetical protein